MNLRVRPRVKRASFVEKINYDEEATTRDNFVGINWPRLSLIFIEELAT